MSHLQIKESPVSLDLNKYNLKGDPIINQSRKLNELAGIFHDINSFELMDTEQTVYTVEAWLPVKEGTQGGLFFGTTNLMPGKVGNEYFMTKGHFHELINRAEFYWCVQGEGMLILMNQERVTWAEEMHPGSLHYVRSNIAHRVANTGNSTLIFGACWPSDAGHDYKRIAVDGFSARLIESHGKPILMES